MDVIQQALRELAVLDGQINSDIIKDLIADHAVKSAKMRSMYEAYKAENLSISKREFEDKTKLNNKLNNDYRGEIIDEIAGYMFGKPIVYQIDNSKYSKTVYETIKNEFEMFKIRNNIENLDNQTGKKAGICGYGARLCYIDREGKERTMDVNPWECIFVTDASIDENQYALRYYDVDVKEKDKWVTRIKVEWYDNSNITFYLQNDKGEFLLDDTESNNPMPHMFAYLPLIKFENNDEEKGDFEKVESLIEAYDRLLSDAQNEIEEFRQAYMAFYGVAPTPDTMTLARQMGAFGMPEATEGSKIEFITKDINDTFLQNHKKTLNENIYKFSKRVDMADEKFSGSAMTGEARKWKLLSLENDAINKERKFAAGLRQQFRVLCSSWNTKQIPIDYLTIFFDFTRNIPVDLSYYAGVSTNLKGHVSERTRLSLMPFIDDVDYEIEQMKQDMADNIDLD